jgi:hypothetical protein
MLPIRHASLFRSRWLALLWAGGVCWSAVAFMTPSTSDDDGQSANMSDADQAANLSRLQALVGKLQH